MRFAKRSSTSAALLVGVVAAAALVALVGVATGLEPLAFGAVAAAILGAAALAIHLLRRQEQEAERARHADQLIAAEQDERRRLALFLHDVPVQAMSGIALMLDGVVDAIDRGKVDDAKTLTRNWTNGLTRTGNLLRSYLPSMIVGGNGAWDLQVYGRPYTVRGFTWGPSFSTADHYMPPLVTMGANTIRTSPRRAQRFRAKLMLRSFFWGNTDESSRASSRNSRKGHALCA